MAKSKSNRVSGKLNRLSANKIDMYDHKSRVKQEKLDRKKWLDDEIQITEMLRENTYGDHISNSQIKANILDLATLLIAGKVKYDYNELIQRIFVITGLDTKRISRILREFIDLGTNNTNNTNITMRLGYIPHYWLGIEAVLKTGGKKIDYLQYSGARKNQELNGYYNPAMKSSLHDILGLTNPKKRKFAPSVEYMCNELGIPYKSQRKVIENYAKGKRYPSSYEKRMDLAVVSTLYMLEKFEYYSQYQFGRPKNEDKLAVGNLLFIYLAFRPDIATNLSKTFSKIQPNYKDTNLSGGIELAGLNFAVHEDCVILAVIHIARELGLDGQEIINATYTFFRNQLETKYSNWEIIGKRQIGEYVDLIMSQDVTKQLLFRTGNVSMINNNNSNDFIDEINERAKDRKAIENLLEKRIYKRSALAKSVFQSMQKTFEKFIDELDKRFKRKGIGE